MQSARSILTAAALLMHSLFGCGIHDACGCPSSLQGEKLCHPAESCCPAAVQSQAVHQDSCHQDHFHTDGMGDQCEADGGAKAGDPAVSHRANLPQDSATVAGHFHTTVLAHFPTPESPRSGCCSLACSFLQSSDIVFSFDSPMVGFVSNDLVGGTLKDRCGAGGLNLETLARRGQDSNDHCILLCTWQL